MSLPGLGNEKGCGRSKDSQSCSPVEEEAAMLGNCPWKRKGTEGLRLIIHRELDPGHDVTECSGGSFQAEP